MQNNKEDMLVKVYELGYHLIPTLAEEEVPQYVNKIKDLLDSYGAVVISEESPKRMELAYTMYPSVNNKKQKYDKSYFGWIKFETDTQSIELFKKAIDAIDEIFRSLIIITIRENTMAPKKLFVSTKKRTSKHGDEEKMDVAVVDKEIDALVEDPKDETMDVEITNDDIIESVPLEEENN